MTQMTRTTLASIDYTLVPELNLASHRSKSSCEAIPSLLSHTNEHTQVCPERPCPGAGLKNKWTREKPEIAYRSSAIFFTRRVLKNAMRLFFSHQIANQDLCVCVCVWRALVVCFPLVSIWRCQIVMNEFAIWILIESNLSLISTKNVPQGNDQRKFCCQCVCRGNLQLLECLHVVDEFFLWTAMSHDNFIQSTNSQSRNEDTLPCWPSEKYALEYHTVV